MNILTYLSFLLLQTASPEWQTYKTTSEVDVFFRTEQCHDEANGIHRENILLKFVNKTDKQVTVSWQLENYYNNVCATCGNDEYKFELTLTPNATVEGNCSSTGNDLRIFVKHLDLPNHKNFTKFELGDLSTSILLSTHKNPRF